MKMNVKRCSAVLVIKEMQMKTTVRYQLTPTRLAIIKKAITNVGECGEFDHSNIALKECKMLQPLWKTVWQFLKMLHIELPYDPVIPLLHIYPRELKTYVHIKTCT